MNDPPVDRPGMTLASVDPQGRLRSLEIVSPEVLDASSPTLAPDWNQLLVAAGFDPAALVPSIAR
jgi:hypothetical protein